MALDANNKIINSGDGIVVDANAVAGGYFVTQSVQITSTGESGKIPDYACITGAMCYCTGNSTFYQCTNGANKTWEPVEFSDAPADGILTIQKNNTNIGTFSANQGSSATINIEVPTALSDLSADEQHRSVSDDQIANWNGKAETTVASTTENGLMSATDKSSLTTLETWHKNNTFCTTAEIEALFN